AQLVADGEAMAILLLWIDDVPHSSGLTIGGPSTLGGQPSEFASEGISVGVVLTEGHAHSFLLVDGIGDAVALHVEPGAEHVLVERHPQPLFTERRRPALPLSLVTVGGGVDDAGGLALEFDRA